MSADQSIELPRDVDDELTEAMARHLGLSDEEAALIARIMQSEHVRWIEAAALSRLLTSAQIEEATKWAERRAATGADGIIEKALRRTTGKELVKVDAPEVKPGPQLLTAHDPYHPRSEKVRALRAELLLLSEQSAMTLAIVGTGEAEGRSLLAAELAIAFGQLGRRTLLVDADMRKPCQHLLFQTENTRGLAQSIEGRDPGTLYRVSGLTATSLLTAGTPSKNPLELLSDRGFDRLMQTWRKQFAFIIFDTPPIGRFADGLTLATQAGNVLVVSRTLVTALNDFKEMLRRLALTRSQLLGAVINDF